MRSITTLTLVLALGLTACPADSDDTATATATVTVTNPMTDGASTTGGGASTTTGGGTTADVSATMTPPTTTDGTTTVEPGTETTVEPGTTTVEPGTTTVEPGTTTTETGPGTTVEPDTTGGGGDESPYNSCATNDDCGMGALCINAALTDGQVKGNVCSPTCSGPGKLCPAAAAGVAAQDPQCLFGVDPMSPTNCAIICIVGMDDCGPGSDCEDIGIPPQMGATPGICTFPAN